MFGTAAAYAAAFPGNDRAWFGPTRNPMRTPKTLCYSLLAALLLSLPACGGAGGGGGGEAPPGLGVAPTETLYVINYLDSGPGSLRDAIENAQPGAWVVFSELLAPGTVNLVTEIEITKPIAIGGLANDGSRFTIDGGGSTRLFNVLPGAHLWLNDLVLANGDAVGGGAIWADDAQLTVHRSAFIGNSGQAHSGGAILALGSHVEIADTNFVANTAQSAGAMHASTSLLNITRSSFYLNSAWWGTGGAVTGLNSDTTIVNSSFLNNTAAAAPWGRGGAIMSITINPNNESNLRVYSSTITGNSANAGGGGIALIVQDASPSTLEIHRSIVAENTAADDHDLGFLGGATGSGTQNIIGIGDGAFFWDGIGENQVGNAVTPIDPLLGAVFTDAHGRVSRTPLELSPANSALTGGTVYGPNGLHLLMDQRGNPRPAAGPNEIGAIERNP